jgi:glucose-1-phosphate cytidylyltransferase
MKKFDVIILCGGKGKRLRPLTNITPKPLTRIKNKPFLEYLITFFLNNKFDNIIIACGYKSYLFKHFIKNRFRDQRIKIIDSGNVDIITRIKDSKKFIKNDFFVCYGDAFAKLDIKKYIKFYIKNKGSTIVTSFYKLQFGVLKVNKKNKNFLEFKEKPSLDEPINIGYFIFPLSIYNYLLKFKNWIGFIKNLIKKKKLKYYNFDDLHLTFNDYGELQVAKTKIDEISNFLKLK